MRLRILTPFLLAEIFVQQGGAIIGRARWQPVRGRGAHFPLVFQIGMDRRREPPGFGDIAYHAAMAVGDEGASHGRVRPPVFLIEILNDLFAGFGIKVHIDIGGHLPLGR